MNGFKKLFKKYKKYIIISGIIILIICIIPSMLIKYLFENHPNQYNYWGGYVSNIIGSILTIAIFAYTLIRQHRNDLKSMNIFEKKQLRNEVLDEFYEDNELISMTDSFQDEINQQLIVNYEPLSGKDINRLEQLHNKDDQLHTEYIINNQMSIKLNSYGAIAPNILKKYCDNLRLPQFTKIILIINKCRNKFYSELSDMDDLCSHLRHDTELSDLEKKNGCMGSSRLKFIKDMLHVQQLTVMNIDLCLKIYHVIYGYIFKLPKYNKTYLFTNIKWNRHLIKANDKVVKSYRE